MVSSSTMASGAGKARHGGIPRDVWGLAVLVLGVVAGLMVMRSGAPPTVARVPDPPAASAPSADPEPAAPSDRTAATIPTTMPRTRAGKLRALRALGVTPHRGPDGKRQLDAAPVIDALNRAGVHDGIAAFPPPGTDPPKSGVTVPDDVVLPEGYVRHHQTTDDGRPLPPILMFHPDYTFTDEQGTPIAIPDDRIVPPELVPPGIPFERLDVPSQAGSR